jgi:hypothetical protein
MSLYSVCILSSYRQEPSEEVIERFCELTVNSVQKVGEALEMAREDVHNQFLREGIDTNNDSLIETMLIEVRRLK